MKLTLPSHWKYARAAYIAVLAAALAYGLLTLFTPPSEGANAYALSQQQRSLLQLTIIVPIITIWLVAIGSALTLKQYAEYIQGSRESRGLSILANGLILLVVYLITTSLIGATLPYFQGTEWLPIMVSLRNHVPVAMSLIAFGTLYLGSQQLQAAANFRVWSSGAIALLIFFCLLTAVFTYQFLINSPTQSARGIPAYALPREVLVFTLVLPSCLSWFLGSLAALNITKFARQVKGSIYRHALRDLAWGIVAAVAFGIFMQVLSLVSRLLLGLSLAPLLAIVYLLLVFYGLGFWFIRRGTRKLARIEVAQ